MRIALAALGLAACGLEVRGTATLDAGANRPEATTDAQAPPFDGGTTSSSVIVLPDGGSQVVEASPDAQAPTDPCPPSPNLFLCLPFDGNITDRSLKALTLTATDLSFGAGKFDQAARFTLNPKSNLQLAAFQDFNTPAATIELWINPTSFPASGSTMSIVDMDGRFGISLNSDGTVSCRGFTLTTKTVLGQWTHIACVNDGTTMFAYANGTLETSGANQLGTTGTWIGIGQNSPQNDRNLDAMLDTLRIWNDARTAAQIADSAR